MVSSSGTRMIVMGVGRSRSWLPIRASDAGAWLLTIAKWSMRRWR